MRRSSRRAVRETRSFPAPLQHFPRVFPTKRKRHEMKLNILSQPLPRLPGDSSIHAMPEIRAAAPGGRAARRAVAVATSAACNGTTNAAGNNILSSERASKRGSRGSGGVIERSPGSLETHFPFPQNERTEGTARPGREGGKKGRGRTRTTALLGRGANQKRGKTRRRRRRR